MFQERIDWIMLLCIIPLVIAGLITMKGFGRDLPGQESDYFFTRQIIWFAIGLLIFFICSFIDWRFLKNSWLLLFLYIIGLFVLLVLCVLAAEVRGAASWFRFTHFSIEPAEPMKLLLILILAKYFSRRHIEIAHIKHIIISGIYAALPAGLIILQPDFGSALIIALIWLGMIMVSGVSKRHLLLVLLFGLILLTSAWVLVMQPYQKERILTFLNLVKDPQGAGYNALQSMIAVGSGGIFGKSIGLGTQSRLEFLPEHENDFIFAAFAEEWGVVGVAFVFIFFGILLWRILRNAFLVQGNFERLFGMGLAILIMAHFTVHVGMNIAILPITGINLPFMSYGGSNLITLFIGLGMLIGMQHYTRRVYHEEDDGIVEFMDRKSVD